MQFRPVVVQSIDFTNKDIVITDPCYIVKNKDKARSGLNLGQCGIYDYITSATYYSDWSCSVWRASSYEYCTEATWIGGFRADSGLVCVANLNEVVNYNKGFMNWLDKHKQCATIIKNFTGKAQFVLNSQRRLDIIGRTDEDVEWIAAQLSP